MFLVTITFTIYFPKVVLWLPKQVIPESVGCFKAPARDGVYLSELIVPEHPSIVMPREGGACSTPRR